VSRFGVDAGGAVGVEVRQEGQVGWRVQEILMRVAPRCAVADVELVGVQFDADPAVVGMREVEDGGGDVDVVAVGYWVCGEGDDAGPGGRGADQGEWSGLFDAFDLGVMALLVAACAVGAPASSDVAQRLSLVMITAWAKKYLEEVPSAPGSRYCAKRRPRLI
jgi:hypothetical protein